MDIHIYAKQVYAREALVFLRPPPPKLPAHMQQSPLYALTVGSARTSTNMKC